MQKKENEFMEVVYTPSVAIRLRDMGRKYKFKVFIIIYFAVSIYLLEADLRPFTKLSYLLL